MRAFEWEIVYFGKEKTVFIDEVWKCTWYDREEENESHGDTLKSKM